MEGANDSIVESHINNDLSLDIDLPNFQPTKYNPFLWRFAHGTTFFLFSIGFLVNAVMKFQKARNKASTDIEDLMSQIASLAGSGMYFISSFMEWFHFRRGCCGRSNLNSMLKTNVDESFKAALYRSEVGIKYFASVLASLIMIGASLMILFKLDEINTIIVHSNVLFLTAVSIMFISQISKVYRILKKTKQYTFRKDKSNLTVELFLMISALLYIVYYSFVIVFTDNNSFIKLNYIDNYVNLGAVFMLFFSALSMQYRYYISGFQDLNMSNVSVFTV